MEETNLNALQCSLRFMHINRCFAGTASLAWRNTTEGSRRCLLWPWVLSPSRQCLKGRPGAPAEVCSQSSSMQSSCQDAKQMVLDATVLDAHAFRLCYYYILWHYTHKKRCIILYLLLIFCKHNITVCQELDQ